MRTATSANYISRRTWLRDAVGGANVVLRSASALEYLRLFGGYLNEGQIDVYSTSRGPYENVNYRIVNNFDNLDIVRDGEILCSSPTQAINDMLTDYDNPHGDADSEALIQALSNYYHSHGGSFEGLYISPQNSENFNLLKDWAMEYYNEG